MKSKTMKSKTMNSKTRNNEYKNFRVSIYCPVSGINKLEDMDQFWEEFGRLHDTIHIKKVYLECHRGLDWCEKEQLIKVRDFFRSKGIETSGGITTNDLGKGEGFESLCYTSERGRAIVKKSVELCAEVFDEFILDDFYFANCRCSQCIREKGGRTWSQFRLEQKRQVTKELIMKRAKEVNPNVKVIIKFPNWYEAYGETGYDLLTEPELFDYIYTGTETRNPTYAQQHLPKYLSYFLMRYLENIAPGRNLGGWFDSYECTYNLTSYLEQGYLTLLAGGREVTLFCLDTLMKDPDYRLFPGAAGQMFEDADSYLGHLGRPVGVAAYRPHRCTGEELVHTYLGMCGIPIEPVPFYPQGNRVIFLAEGAAGDTQIVKNMQESLEQGGDLIVTSGFVEKLGSDFHEFMTVSCSSRKAIAEMYAVSRDHGLSISGSSRGSAPVLIPQLDYYTNDVWELGAAYGTDSNIPILLQSRYANGRITVLTVPDQPGDLYHYPTEVLDMIREVFCHGLICKLEAKSRIMLFLYDNDKVMLRSDLPYTEIIALKLHNEVSSVFDVLHQKEIPVTDHRITLELLPGVQTLIDLKPRNKLQDN